MKGDWYQVVADTFVCGVRVERGDVVETAPVLHWVLVRADRSFEWLKSYAAARGWAINQFTIEDNKVKLVPVIAGSAHRRRRGGRSLGAPPTSETTGAARGSERDCPPLPFGPAPTASNSGRSATASNTEPEE